MLKLLLILNTKPRLGGRSGKESIGGGTGTFPVTGSFLVTILPILIRKQARSLCLGSWRLRVGLIGHFCFFFSTPITKRINALF